MRALRDLPMSRSSPWW